MPTNWNDFAAHDGLRAVLDPADELGFKNSLIDAIHWRAFARHLGRARRLLDFGCGYGRFAARVMGQGIEYTGVDAAENMVGKARTLHPSGRFEALQGDVIPFGAGAFDTVLSCCVFQYVIHGPHCRPLLGEIARVIGPGGRLLLVEQVSRSGSTSGTVDRVATEADYADLLSESFIVKKTMRIRGYHPFGPGRLALRVGGASRPLFRLLVGALASLEIRSAERAADAHYEKEKYYDFFILAEAKAPR